MNILMIYPSWEERAILGFAKDIESSIIDKVIVFENANPINAEHIAPFLTKIQDVCREHRIECDKQLLQLGSSSVWNVLKDQVNSLDIDDRVTLDISTMSRNLIWALLFFLKGKVQYVSIVYHQPKSYSHEWLSRDAEFPRLLFKHSGIVSIEKQTLLVIVSGFDPERTKQLVYFYNPSKVILLIQKSNQFDSDIRNTPKPHVDECEKMGIKTDYISIDCYDDYWGQKEIEEVVSRNINNYNIILSSLGPKLSAISVYRVYLNHPEIALTYIPCKEYNVNYSKGIGDSFINHLIFE